MSFATLAALLVLMLRGGGNELLDYIPSQPYWRTKSVMPSVDHLAKELQGIKADDTSKASAIRKLMALRTLGEIRNPAAVTVLQGYLDSKEMFVADYARRALAMIEGRPATRPSPTLDRRVANLNIIPPNCAAIAQLNPFSTGEGGVNAVDVDAFFVSAAFPPELDRVVIAERFTTSLLSLAEKVGNVRIDGITMGVSDDVAEEAGFAMAAVRGQYDAAAARAALKETARDPHEVEALAFYEMGNSMAAAAVDDELFVFMVGASTGRLPERDVAMLIKTKPKGFSTTPQIARLLKTVDARLPLWAIAYVTPAYQESAVLAPFEAIRLQVAPREKGIEFVLRGRQHDGADMHEGMNEFMQSVNHLQAIVQVSLARAPFLEPVRQLLTSIHVEEEGPVAVAKGILRAPPEDLLRIAVMFDPLVIETVASAPPPPAAPPAPAATTNPATKLAPVR